MNATRTRLAWLVVIGLAQTGLAAGAVSLCLWKTESEPWAFSCSSICWGTGNDFRGYPVPWEQYTQTYYMTASGLRTISRGTEPPEFVGRNWGVPAVLVAIAITFPPAVASFGRVFRRTAAPPLRRGRACRAGLFAGVATIAALWLAAETEIWFSNTPWEASPPGNRLYEMDQSRRVREAVRDARRWAGSHSPAAADLLAPEWPARTKLTAAVFLTTFVFGCVLFRVWRGASAPAAPGGASPPAASGLPPAARGGDRSG